MLRHLPFFLLGALPLFSHTGEVEEKIRSHFYGPGLESLAVSDWTFPSREDYLLVQSQITKNYQHTLFSPIDSRPFATYPLNTELYCWISYRMGKIRLLSDDIPEPVSETIYFNGQPENKDKCIICYVSSHLVGSGSDFPRGLRYLIESLKTFGFDGHLLYRMGGWPSIKRERLKHADVPYAFKPFLFEEARDLGYKKILWLDAASIPVKSLAPIFAFLEERGCCFFASPYQKDVQLREVLDRRYILDSLHVSRLWGIKNLLTQVVGINMENPRASLLLDRWIEGAIAKVPFLDSSADQFAFSVLAADLGLLEGILPTGYYIEGTRGDFTLPKRSPEAIIFHQYDFLHPDSKVPADIFH